MNRTVSGLARLIGIVSLTAIVGMRAGAQSAGDLFQRALVLERASGKLDSAILLYQRVVKEAGADRALAGRALLRLGDAYELLGRAEARAAYERVLREFGDQRDLVSQARSRIAALDLGGRQNGAAVASGQTTRRMWENSEAGAPHTTPSPDGRLFAFTDWETGDLAVHDLASGEDRRLSHNATPYQDGYAESATFSPDASEIAYQWWTNAKYELRIVSTRGGPSRVVLGSDVGAVYGWSSAGNRILGMVIREKKSQLAWIDPKDGSTRLVREMRGWPINASVSPDGQWIVFDELSSDKPLASYELRIIAADGSRYRALLDQSAGDYQPYWTPDGRGVAFLSERTGSRGVWFVEIANGSARGQPTLLKGDMGANIPVGFSPSGSFYFYTPATHDVQVATIDPQTGKPNQPPAFIARAFLGSHQHPEWSPDGRSLAFILMRGSGMGMPYSRVIEVLDVETGARRELTPDLSQLFLPRWSSDGKSLLVWGVRGQYGTADAGFYTIDVVSGALSEIYRGPNPRGIKPSAWSADGRSIYYVVQDSTSDALWRFDRADTSRHLILSDKDAHRLFSLALSSDGRSLAFTILHPAASASGKEWSVTRVLSLVDGAIHDVQLPRPEWFVQSLNATPDGAFVGVAQRKSDGMAELWRVPADGGMPRKLDLEGKSLYALRLSRDGRKVAFEAGASETGVGFWVIDGLLPRAAGKPDK